MSIYDLSVMRANGEQQLLSVYQGKVLLIVNTASKCGFTPQFAGLEALHQQYSEQGLQVLGFPCNQFGKQDPGSNDDIQSFCQLNYGVSFPVFAKVEVNGKNTHPLFQYLKAAAPGLLFSQSIKWNFTKFLVDSRGNAVTRYGPKVMPEKLVNKIQLLLSDI